MLCAISIPALADDGGTFASNENVLELTRNEYKQFTTIDNEIALTNNGHGQFTAIDDATANRMSKDELVKSFDAVFVTATKDDEIFCYENDQYLISVSESTYLLTDKINVNIDNFPANEALFDKYGISDDSRKEMEAEIAEQKALGNDDFYIEIFAPRINSDRFQEKDPNGIPLRTNNESEGTHYYSYYDSKTGFTHSMRDVIIASRNRQSGMIQKSGTITLSTAKSFVDFVVTAADISSKTLRAFALFDSAYELFKAIKGPVVTTSSGDNIYTNLWSDVLKKTTASMWYNSWSNTLVTYKVWLNKHDCYQAYSSTGQSWLETASINQVVYSKNFTSPQASAIAYLGYPTQYDAALSTKIFGTTVILINAWTI